MPLLHQLVWRRTPARSSSTMSHRSSTVSILSRSADCPDLVDSVSVLLRCRGRFSNRNNKQGLEG
jgi:hypothetical protein